MLVFNIYKSIRILPNCVILVGVNALKEETYENP